MKKITTMKKLILGALLFAGTQVHAQISIQHIGSYQNVGKFEVSAAEISVYDTLNKQLFVVNNADTAIDIISILNPTTPTLVTSVKLGNYGGFPNSVAINGNLVAVAVDNFTKHLNGKVVFLNLAGVYINDVAVGALPDMLTFTADGSKVLVANEGEPSDDYLNDPEGSVSIIDVSNGAANAIVNTVDFDSYSANLVAVKQGFESSTTDNWNYSVYPQSYNDTINQDVWAIVQDFSTNVPASSEGIKFWGGRDLENQLTNGRETHYIIFDKLDISNLSNISLSFDYISVALDTPDSLGYAISYMVDGQLGNKVSLLKNTTAWTTENITVPSGAKWVRLTLWASQNGGSDYLGFDNVLLAGTSGHIIAFDNRIKIANPGLSSFAQDLEPEYITIDNASQKAYVSLQENNAFAVIDIQTASIDTIYSLGFKNHNISGNGFDGSDKDNAINITEQPALGMFQPDAITNIQFGGSTYILTANEGDARNYSAYSEEVRLKNIVLDSFAFPNYAQLQHDDTLGRVRITNAIGETNFDGMFDEFYTYGARSFSIFDISGNLIYDSGDDIEQQVAIALPTQFNSNNNDNNSFDSRSDDKGPEPEAIAVGTVNNITYAFIGLERVGGIIVYDITNPTSPVFAQYINHRDFSFSADSLDALDLGVESIVFIPASESPNNKDLLVTANEVSGSVSLFEVTDLSVGINVNKSFNNLIAYPNPTKNSLNFNELVSGVLIDMYGKVVLNFTNTKSINLDDLAQGIYFVRINNSSIKIIKN